MRSLPFLTIVLLHFRVLGQTVEIDTTYLPLYDFVDRFDGLEYVDSMGVYLDIQFLKAFDEEPIYCCESDSIIRILSINSSGPSTITKLHRNGDRMFVYRKIGNKVGLDNSYLDSQNLKGKELKRFENLMTRIKEGHFEMNFEDSIVYEKARVKDTIAFKFSQMREEVTFSEWKKAFYLVNDHFFEISTKPQEVTLGFDGYTLLIETRTKKG